ncbi:hypothetical protein Bca101_071033 [Brassica carinata]
MTPPQNPCTFDVVTCRDDNVSWTDLCSKPLKVGSRAVATSLLSLARLKYLFLSESDPHKPRHFWFQVPCFFHQLGFAEELYFVSFIDVFT